jgi:hypothetical protein
MIYPFILIILSVWDLYVALHHTILVLVSTIKVQYMIDKMKLIKKFII